MAQLISVVFTEKSKRDFQSLPASLQKRTQKKLLLLEANMFHPSLRVKKMQGSTDYWEGSISMQYRFVFKKQEDVLTILRIGPHDTGLGKK